MNGFGQSSASLGMIQAGYLERSTLTRSNKPLGGMPRPVNSVAPPHYMILRNTNTVTGDQPYFISFLLHCT